MGEEAREKKAARKKNQRRRKETLFLCALICAFGISASRLHVHAAEPGVVASASAKVYGEMNTDGEALANLLSGSTVTAISAHTAENGSVWYLVETDTGTRGYVQAAEILLTGSVAQTQEEAADNAEDGREEASAGAQEDAGGIPAQETADAGQGAQTVNNANNQNTTPNEENDGEAGEENQGSGLYRLRIIERANLRREPSASVEAIIQLPQGTELESFEEKENDGKELWYGVSYNGVSGYIRSDTAEILEDIGVSPLDTGQQTQAADTGSAYSIASLNVEKSTREAERAAESAETVNVAETEHSGAAGESADMENTGRIRKAPDFFFILLCAFAAICAAGFFYSMGRVNALLSDKKQGERKKQQQKAPRRKQKSRPKRDRERYRKKETL